MVHYIPLSCRGVTCHMCKQRPAAHKVEEVIFDDDPFPIRHPLTAYTCERCFASIMGTFYQASEESNGEQKT